MFSSYVPGKTITVSALFNTFIELLIDNNGIAKEPLPVFDPSVEI